MKKYFFIINPGSNHGNSGNSLNTIREFMASKNIPFEYKETTTLDHAYELSRKANLEGHEVIVAVGGDGTINKVINGFYDSFGKRLSKAVLGVIHTGTSPDFCKSYGIPSDLKKALDTLLKGSKKQISIAKIEYLKADEKKAVYFACCASLGLGAHVAAYANSGVRKYFGDTLGTLISIIRSLAVYRSDDLVLVTDGKESEVKNNCITFIGKTTYIASGLKISNDLTADDRRLFVVSIRNVNLMNFIPVLNTLYSGKPVIPGDHISFEYAGIIQIKSLKSNSKIELDGDPLNAMPPCTVSVAEDNLEVITDEDEL
jgi:diacylglycerol kinase (ATP)